MRTKIVGVLFLICLAISRSCFAATIIVGTATHTGGSGNANNAIPVPAGTINGDTLLFCFKLDTTTVTTLGGTFTSCTNFASLVDATSGGMDMKCGCRTASSEPASYTPTWTGSSTSIGEIAVLRNSDGTTPAIDVTPTTSNDATNPAMITTSTNNDLIIEMILDATGNAGLITSGDAPFARSLNIQNAHILYAGQKTAGATSWMPSGLAYSGAGTRLGMTIAVKSNTTTAATFTGRSYDTYNSGSATTLVVGAPANANANDTLIIPITELTPSVAITPPPIIALRGCAVPTQPNGTASSIVFNRSAFVDVNGVAAPPLSGDMLVAGITAIGTVTKPTGFTQQTSVTWGGGQVSSDTKTAGGSEPSSYTFSVTGNNMYAGALCAFFDTSGGTLTVGAVSGVTTASATSSTGARITTGNNNAAIWNYWVENVTNPHTIVLPTAENKGFIQASNGAVAQAMGWFNLHTAGLTASMTASSGDSTSGVWNGTQIEIYSSTAAALSGSTVWVHQSPTAVKNESGTVQEDLYSMVAPVAGSAGPSLFIFASSESSSDAYMVALSNLNTTTPLDVINSLRNEGLSSAQTATIPNPSTTDELSAVFMSYATCTPISSQTTGTWYPQTMIGSGRASAYLMTPDFAAAPQVVDQCGGAYASIAVGLQANTAPTATSAELRANQMITSIFSTTAPTSAATLQQAIELIISENEYR